MDGELEERGEEAGGRIDNGFLRNCECSMAECLVSFA